MSDVPGLLRDPKNPQSVVPQLKLAEVDGMKRSGVIDKGMIPKVDSATAAIQAGVEKVSLWMLASAACHALSEILTSSGVGTEVVI